MTGPKSPPAVPLADLRQAQVYVDEAFETLTDETESDKLRPRKSLTAAEIDTAAESLAHATNFLSRVRATLGSEVPPTWADEPPWCHWFSCEDCHGWFNDAPVCYDNGSEVCDRCAEKRDLRGDEVTRQRQRIAELEAENERLRGGPIIDVAVGVMPVEQNVKLSGSAHGTAGAAKLKGEG